MRRTVLILVIALVTVSLFAAGQKDSVPTTPSVTTISMTWWGDTKRNDVYNAVIDLFETANPGVKVERPFSTWALYFDKLSTQLAGGAAPDVIGMHQRYVSEYASRGALLDMQKFVDSGVIDISNMPKSIPNNGYVNGKLLMISQGVTGSGIGYNTGTFDKLGVPYPSMNWTYDEYVATLKVLKQAAQAKGITIWPGTDLSFDFYNFSYWVRAKGENLFTADGNIGFSRNTLIEWFKFNNDLRNQKLICDAATSVEYTGIPLEQSLFANNKAAIVAMPASQLILYQKQVTDAGKISIIRFPRFKDGPNPEYISGAYYTINASSKNPELAAKLINFFINDPQGQKIFKQEQGVPPMTTGIQAIVGDLSEPEKKSIDFIQNQLVANASPEPYPPAGYNEINSNYVNTATAVAFGELTPEKAADDFLNICKQILKK